MSIWDWSPYLTGGGTRPDAMSGLMPEFNTALQGMFAAAPPEIQSNLRVTSAFRSPEVQAGLWQDALAKYGSPEEARKWVAPPGKSQHNHGNAADLKYLSPEAQAWAHENASKYGLSFPLSNENWHIELATARGNNPAPTFGTPQQGLLPPSTNPADYQTAAENGLNAPQATIWDQMAQIGKGMVPKETQAPQIQQRQAQAYTAQARDDITPYLQLFASMRK